MARCQTPRSRLNHRPQLHESTSASRRPDGLRSPCRTPRRGGAFGRTGEHSLPKSPAPGRCARRGSGHWWTTGRLQRRLGVPEQERLGVDAVRRRGHRAERLGGGRRRAVLHPAQRQPRGNQRVSQAGPGAPAARPESVRRAGCRIPAGTEAARGPRRDPGQRRRCGRQTRRGHRAHLGRGEAPGHPRRGRVRSRGRTPRPPTRTGAWQTR